MRSPQTHGWKPGMPRTPGVWRAMASFIVWALAFVVLYVGHALGCLYVPSTLAPASLTMLLTALWALHLAACAVLTQRSGRRSCGMRREGNGTVQARFMWRVTFLTDALALLAVLVTGLPLLAFPVCQA